MDDSIRLSTPVSVVCAIIFDSAESRFLAAQRASGKALEGKWEFPGGKVEQGESSENALKRELEEELGIQIEIRNSLPHVVHAYPKITIRLIPFVVAITGGDLRPKEHAAIAWIDPQNWERYDWADADVPVLKHLFSNFQG